MNCNLFQKDDSSCVLIHADVLERGVMIKSCLKELFVDVLEGKYALRNFNFFILILFGIVNYADSLNKSISTFCCAVLSLNTRDMKFIMKLLNLM